MGCNFRRYNYNILWVNNFTKPNIFRSLTTPSCKSELLNGRALYFQRKPTGSWCKETGWDQERLKHPDSQPGPSLLLWNWCHRGFLVARWWHGSAWWWWHWWLLARWWHGSASPWWWWHWWPAGGPAVTEGSGRRGGGLRRPSAMGHPWKPIQPTIRDKHSRLEKYSWQNQRNTVDWSKRNTSMSHPWDQSSQRSGVGTILPVWRNPVDGSQRVHKCKIATGQWALL